jgi:hypothetical protein
MTMSPVPSIISALLRLVASLHGWSCLRISHFALCSVASGFGMGEAFESVEGERAFAELGASLSCLMHPRLIGTSCS